MENYCLQKTDIQNQALTLTHPVPQSSASRIIFHMDLTHTATQDPTIKNMGHHVCSGLGYCSLQEGTY